MLQGAQGGPGAPPPTLPGCHAAHAAWGSGTLVPAPMRAHTMNVDLSFEDAQHEKRFR